MITIDFETRSFAELGGTEGVGAWAYSEHPTTTVLCLGYKFDDGPTNIWAPWENNLDDLRVHQIAPPGPCEWDGQLIELLARVSSGEFVCAHNAFFELSIWENIMVKRYGWPKIPRRQWYCTAAQARANGLPGKLALAAKVLGLELQKGGQNAMRRMMKPRSHWLRKGVDDVWFATEQDYRELCEYCVLDVDVEHELYRKTSPLTLRERRIWMMDLEINLRGLNIDTRLAEGAQSVFLKFREKAASELAELTEGQVQKPTETAKLVTWVRSQGLHIPNCQKSTLAEILSDDNIASHIRQVLDIRSAWGGAAALKYGSFLRHLSLDKRVLGELLYWGAHTGRWASMGVQLQNIARNRMEVDEAYGYISCFYEPSVDRILASLRERGLPMEKLDALLTTLIRAVLIPDPGYEFVDIDYSSIEARIIAWLAGQEELIELFRSGVDVYSIAASGIYGIDLSEVTSKQRSLGKEKVLSMGYGIGKEKFFNRCVMLGLDVTRTLTDSVHDLYRLENPKIVQYWYDFEHEVRKAMVTGRVTQHGTKKIVYDRSAQILSYTLPNGRKLSYHHCRIEQGDLKYFGRLPPPRSGYGQVYTWGGKLTENEDSAIGRDYMALGGMELHKLPDVQLMLTIHDEFLLQVKKDKLKELLPVVLKASQPSPLWAKGLPTDVGYWTGPQFRKD